MHQGIANRPARPSNGRLDDVRVAIQADAQSGPGGPDGAVDVEFARKLG
ncbi:hypothetical protein [Speluncibacter jeojiensis]|uniref:Uncharacterized protein n=1 Tax=Speluncibacter jeojiensis TaxID=2710754 RepID=A0A9X4RC16_9ACTN|nr:hypothetical protein [Rhodococcus sp. D2-41]MDG3013039.1 hypothetical protein [Corynebacteriales bacterium D3-21]